MKSEHERAGRIWTALDDLLKTAQWPDRDSDPLDKLLRTARWPEANAEASRLWQWWRDQQHFRHVVDLRKVKWRNVTFAALAAAVTASFIVLTVWNKQPSRSKPVVAEPAIVAGNSAPKPIVPAATSAHVDSFNFAAGPRRIFTTRPEDIIEQMQLARSQALTRLAPESDDPIDQILAQRIAEPDGDLQELAEPLLADREDSERHLLERLQTFTGERAVAATELLGCIGSEVSLPYLMRLSRMPQTHEPAVRALLKLADTRILRNLH